MAKWTKKKVTPEEINNGNEYTVNDNLSVESINAIINNSFKAQEDSEEALKKANSSYEANGTLVKINGVNQTTWDATFSQKLYEESLNKLNIELTSTLSNGIYYFVNEKGNLVLNGTVLNDGDFHIQMKPIILNGDYYFKCFNDDYNKKIGLVDYWSIIGSTYEGYIHYNGQVDKIWFYEMTAGYTFNNYEIELMLTEGITEPKEFQIYNQKMNITNGEAEFLKYEFEKSKNQITFGYGSGNNEYSNGTNSTLDNNKVILTGTPTQTWANMSRAIERKIDIGNYVLSINKAFSFSFAIAFNHADGTATTGYIYKGNISNKVQFTKEVISYRIYFEDLVVGQTYNETVEVQLERGNLATDVLSYQGGDFAQIGNIKPIKVWGNAQPTTEFASQTASFSESVLDASLVRIDVRRSTSSYAGTLSFFVKPDALGGSIPLSVSFVEGGTEYRPSRTCTFYNHAGLYFDNGYLGTSQNNDQMIPVAIYKYKY